MDRGSGAGAAACCGRARPARTLRLTNVRQSIVGADYPQTAAWSYNGTVPGPELRFKQGGRLKIEVENALGVDTTVHLHMAPRVVLGPGLRADLMLDCVAAPGSRHRIVDDFYQGRAYRLLDLLCSNEKPLRETFAPVPRLSPNPVPEPKLAGAERHRVRFEGGMMGRMPMTREQGDMMSRMPMMRDRGGMVWTVNGRSLADHSHHNHEPMLTLARGRSYVLELINDTAWHYPIHLNGHTFAVLSRNGEPNARREWSDTVLLDPEIGAEIAFVADNPGDWMFHCHVLEHQASGMMAVIRVA